MWRLSRPCPTPSSTHSAFLAWRHRRALNLIEPPWYGPVCPVVWEGRGREAPPYPDQRLEHELPPRERRRKQEHTHRPVSVQLIDDGLHPLDHRQEPRFDPRQEV